MIVIFFNAQDEFISSVALPLLSNTSEEPDSDVRCDASRFTVFLLDKCAPKWAPSLLAIINEVTCVCVASYHVLC